MLLAIITPSKQRVSRIVIDRWLRRLELIHWQIDWQQAERHDATILWPCVIWNDIMALLVPPSVMQTQVTASTILAHKAKQLQN